MKVAPHTATKKPVLPVIDLRKNCQGLMASIRTRGSASKGPRKKR